MLRLAGGDVFLVMSDIQMFYDFGCCFGIFIYNMFIHRMDTQAIHNQQPIVRKLQSATASLETILERYQGNEDPLELAEQLQAVIKLIRGIRREVLLQELTTVLHNEDLPTATRKDKVVKLFQLLARQEGTE
jgi:hypothetical protein